MEETTENSMESMSIKIKNSTESFIIDAEDFEKVSAYKWSIEYGVNGRRYIRCRVIDKGKQKCIYLSHIILGFGDSDKKKVRYLNQNTLDLRKSNLKSSFNGKQSFLKIYFTKNYRKKNPSPSPWALNIYFPETSKSTTIGMYKSKEFAEKVIEYIEKNNIVLSSFEDVKIARDKIRLWAVEKGYSNGYTKNGLNALKKGFKIASIGDEKISGDYVFVKTENGWKPKHHVIWEEGGNIIPENYRLFFKDGNNRNFDLENLEAVSLNEFLLRNNLRKFPKEFRPTLDLLWQLRQAIRNQEVNNPKRRRLGDSFSVNIDFSTTKRRPNKPPWRVQIYCPSIDKNDIYIGCYRTREIAQEITDFVKNSNFSIKTHEDLMRVKFLAKEYAVEKDYYIRLKPGPKPKNNLIQTNTAERAEEQTYA